MALVAKHLLSSAKGDKGDTVLAVCFLSRVSTIKVLLYVP